MNEDADAYRALAELSNITETIAKVAQLKPRMSPTEYRQLLDKLYERKRAVQSRLGALRPVSKNDLRVATKWGHYEQ